MGCPGLMHPLVKSMKLLLLLTIMALLVSCRPNLLQTCVGRTGLIASPRMLLLPMTVVRMVLRSLSSYLSCVRRRGRDL